MLFLVLCLLSYLLGSIPFGLLFVRWAGKGDIRDIGSGNIGTTNVLRTGSKRLAVATLLADVLKGAFPVVLGLILKWSEFSLCVLGGLAILGHIFPAWLRFRGGKGVATALGVYFALSPLIGGAVLLTWLVMTKVVRISSLSALVSLFMAPLYAAVMGKSAVLVMFMMIVYMLIVWTHRENIRRLINGEESLIGRKK